MVIVNKNARVPLPLISEEQINELHNTEINTFKARTFRIDLAKDGGKKRKEAKNKKGAKKKL